MKVALFILEGAGGDRTHLAKETITAFERQGALAMPIVLEGGKFTKSDLSRIEAFAPDLTLSFHPIHRDERGNFLSDYLNIPHLFWLHDSSIHSLDALFAKHHHVASVDLEESRWLKAHGVNDPFFLSHGVRGYKVEEEKRKSYDVVFFGSFIDFPSLKSLWRSELSKKAVLTLEGAIELAKEKRSNPLVTSLEESYRAHRVQEGELDDHLLYSLLEKYLLGKSRYDLLTSLVQVELHVFGDPHKDNPGRMGWKEVLAPFPNIKTHPGASYEKRLQVLKQSKCALVPIETFRNAFHETLLLAPLFHAMPFTTANPLILEAFSKDITFNPKEIALLSEEMRYYVSHEKARREEVAGMQKKVQSSHTLDCRVLGILEKFQGV